MCSSQFRIPENGNVDFPNDSLMTPNMFNTFRHHRHHRGSGDTSNLRKRVQTCFYAAIFHFQSFLMLVAQLSSPLRVTLIKTVIWRRLKLQCAVWCNCCPPRLNSETNISTYTFIDSHILIQLVFAEENWGAWLRWGNTYRFLVGTKHSWPDFIKWWILPSHST